MQYKEAVAEARQLVRRSEEDQWRLAQLTWEQMNGGVSQRQWARDTGMARSHVQTLQEIWERWGGLDQAERPRYTDASSIVLRRLDVEPEDALDTTRHERAKSTVRNMPPEQKAELVREALDDEEVAVRVLRDPHTRRNVTDAREQVVHEIEDAARDRTEADPTSRAIREASLTLTIESNISKARFWLAESTRQIQELEDRDPAVMERFAGDVDEVELALGWLRTAIEGGRVSDEDLARLLEGGA